MTKEKPDLQTSPSGYIQEEFTNREEEIAQFERLLSDTSAARLPLLMFHGVGGAGKTWLLQRAQSVCEERRILHTFLDFSQLDFSQLEALKRGDPVQTLCHIADQMQKQRIRSPAARVPVVEHWMERKPVFDDFSVVLAAISQKAHLRTAQDVPVQSAVRYVVQQLLNAVSLIASVPVLGYLVTAASMGVAANDKKRRKEIEKRIKDLRQLSDEKLAAALIKAFADDLTAQMPQSRNPHAVLFFDGHEALREEKKGEAQYHDDWLPILYKNLAAHGVLIVVAGHEPLAWNDKDILLQQHKVSGLLTADARLYLQKFDIPARAPAPLIEAVLRVTQEQDTPEKTAPDGTARHYCFSLSLCASIVTQEFQSKGRYPDPDSFDAIFHAAESESGIVTKLIARLLRGFSGAMQTALKELALSESFDEAFAIALTTRENGGPYKTQVGWNRLRSLPLLWRDRSGLYRMNNLLQDALRAEFLTNAAQRRKAYAVHLWAFDHWATRGAESAGAISHYVVEQSDWQQRVEHSLYHLCFCVEQCDPGDSRKAVLDIASKLLDIFWWWAENFQYDFWDRLLGASLTAIRAAAHSRPGGDNPQKRAGKRRTKKDASQIGDLEKLIYQFHALNAAWPKGLRKHAGEWDAEVRGKWGDGVVDRWSWEEVLKRVSEMREILCPSVSSGAPSESTQSTQTQERTEERMDARSGEQAGSRTAELQLLEGHLAAMTDYYAGYARQYLAEELERSHGAGNGGASGAEEMSAQEGSLQHLHEAEAALLRHESWFAPGGSEPDALKWAWARRVLAEIYAAGGQPRQAENAAREALKRLSQVQGEEEEGACMECAADVHALLASLYADSDPRRSGLETGRALTYSVVYRAIDRDAYTLSYYSERRAIAAQQLRRYADQSPEKARDYLNGFCEGWNERWNGNADALLARMPVPDVPDGNNAASESGSGKDRDVFHAFHTACTDLPEEKPSEAIAEQHRAWVKTRLEIYLSYVELDQEA